MPHAARIRVEQVKVLRGAALSTVAMNLSAVVLLGAYYQPVLPAWLLVGWFAFNLLHAVIIFIDRRMADGVPSVWHLREVTIRAICLGIAWGSFIWFVASVSPPDQMIVIGMVMSGIMAGGATRLAITPRAAWGFLWSISLLSIAGCFHQFGFWEGIVPALLLVAYALFLTHLVAAYSAVQFRSWIDGVELATRNETISLLLNNFHENANDWVWEINAEGKIRSPSDRFREAAGIRTLAGGRFLDLFEEGEQRDLLARKIARGEHFRDLPVTLKVRREPRYWVLSGRRATAGGYQGVASDVTDKIVAQNRLAYLAHFDELTGLHSRARFREVVEHAVATPRVDELVLLCCLDLDRFKTINDTMGHPFGDALLAAVGKRLRQGMAPSDVVARLGGDEFAVLRRVPQASWLKEEAGRDIVALFDAPFKIGDAVVALDTCVGVRIIEPAEKCDADGVMRDADVALYRAKSLGRGSCQVFEPGMARNAARRLALEQALRKAVDNAELRLAYQPFVSMDSGQIVGMEALLRWDSPEFGVVAPDEFIPIAEESGLILTIGSWALRQALCEATRWPEHIRIAVNLSPLQFQSQALAALVAAELRALNFNPDRLELEITESTLIAGTETSLACLTSLKMLGVRIALDDFGTGFSSLSYLCQFPFDKIKIDKSFVDGIGKSPANAAVVKAIKQLGDALGMVITVEGVEDEAQLMAVRELGCHQVQGFLLAAPLPARRAEELLAANFTLPAEGPAQRASL